MEVRSERRGVGGGGGGEEGEIRNKVIFKKRGCFQEEILDL